MVNYSAALGRPLRDPQVANTLHRASANFGEALADSLLIGALGRAEVEEMVEAEGLEHLQAVAAEGRGGIFALPHTGSWDLCGALAAILGYKVVAVAEPMPGSLNREIVAARSHHGLRIVMLGQAGTRELIKMLREGRLLALLCDLPHGPGVEVKFLGRRARVPAGPGVLSLRYSVPILPVYSRRIAPGRYQAHVDPPICPPAYVPERAREQTADLMQQVMAKFETFIRQYPDQWYAFRPILH
jgi:lauroyl/myristoyl acyltransferase